VKQKGWIGVGWHCFDCPEDGMTNADFAIGIFDSHGNVTVRDYMSEDSINKGYAQPVLDTAVGGYNNIISYSGYQTDEESVMIFQKPIVTNDTKGDHFLVGGSVLVLFAYAKDGGSQSNIFQYHGGSHRGSQTISFYTGISRIDTLRYWHGALMIISFAFCMSFGIFIARYLKEYYWWFPLHIMVQVGGVLGSLSAFAIAIVMTHSHFSNIHSWFGIVVMCFAIMTPALGWVADMVFNPSRTSPPMWPDKFHWWFGRITVVLSYVTIVLGMRQLGAVPIFEIAFIGAIVFYFILYLFLEIYRWTNRTNVHHTSQSPLLTPIHD